VPGVARGKKCLKKIEIKKFDFLGFVTHRLPISVHKKFQPIWSSRLAGYRKLFVFKGPVNVFSSDPHFIPLQDKLESVKLSLYHISSVVKIQNCHFFQITAI